MMCNFSCFSTNSLDIKATVSRLLPVHARMRSIDFDIAPCHVCAAWEARRDSRGIKMNYACTNQWARADGVKEASFDFVYKSQMHLPFFFSCHLQARNGSLLGLWTSFRASPALERPGFFSSFGQSRQQPQRGIELSWSVK